LIAVKKFKVVSDITGVDQKKQALIKNEIQKYRRLEHPHIVEYYGCEVVDQSFCIYLEQMETSLANIIAEYGAFDEESSRLYTH
jgi:serine/threonine protein kinase